MRLGGLILAGGRCHWVFFRGRGGAGAFSEIGHIRVDGIWQTDYEPGVHEDGKEKGGLRDAPGRGIRVFRE